VLRQTVISAHISGTTNMATSTDQHAPLVVADGDELPAAQPAKKRRVDNGDGGGGGVAAAQSRALQPYTDEQRDRMVSLFQKGAAASTRRVLDEAEWAVKETKAGNVLALVRRDNPEKGYDWPLPPMDVTVFPAPSEITGAHTCQITFRVEMGKLDPLLSNSELHTERADGGSLYSDQPPDVRSALDFYEMYVVALPEALTPDVLKAVNAPKRLRAAKGAKAVEAIVHKSIWRDSGRPDEIKVPLQIKTDAKTGVEHAAISLSFYMAPLEGDGSGPKSAVPVETLAVIGAALPVEAINTRLAVYCAANPSAKCKTNLFAGLVAVGGGAPDKLVNLPFSELMPAALIPTQGGGFAKVFGTGTFRSDLKFSPKSKLLSNRDKMYNPFKVYFVAPKSAGGAEQATDAEQDIYAAIATENDVYGSL
jgi:hypothetical protein